MKKSWVAGYQDGEKLEQVAQKAVAAPGFLELSKARLDPACSLG